MRLRIKIFFLIFVLLAYINLPVISAQEEVIPIGVSKKPVMYSVFWNTLWGSAWGATMGFSYHLISGIQLRESLITSTTLGGVLGYGLGIYLVVGGLSFDKSYLLELPSPQQNKQQTNSVFIESEMRPLFSRKVIADQSKWEVSIISFRF